MINLGVQRRSGSSLLDAARSMRDVPARVFPYAAATGMTRTAQALAKTELPAEMRKRFDRPTPWTLNSLAIEPATKDKLTAGIFVKNTASGTAIAQERYLLPGVEGGTRNEKRFERALRYAGLLGAGERVYPGRQMERDAYGGIPSELIRSVVAWAKAGGGKRTKRTKTTPASNPRGYYLFGKPGGVRGVAQRSGPIALPLLIFSRSQPRYTQRLDFTGVSERFTLQRFPVEFDRAAQAILSRPR